MDRSRAQVTSVGGRHPRWSADGSELFYVTPAEDVVWVPVRPGPGFTTGPHVRLFSRRPLATLPESLYDGHPDGDRFLMFTAAGPGAGESGAHLVVVENFVTELETVKR